MSCNQVTILEAVNQCSYNTNMKDYITNIIFELCTYSKTAKYYKCNRVLGNSCETIIVIRYQINTKFLNRLYEIPILIYIPSMFPYSAPEIYLERSSNNIGVNENNRDIDPKTNRIKTKEINNWNSYSTLQNVMSEITMSFCNVFPIYQITNKNPQVNTNYNEPQNVQVNNNINQAYQQYQFQQQQFVPQTNQPQQNWSGYNRMNSNQSNNISPNDNTYQYDIAIKSILIDDIKRQISKPISEEVRRLTREKEKLNNYRNVFQNLIKKYNEYLLRRDEIIPHLDDMIKNVDFEHSKMKRQCDTYKNNSINKQNCFSLITLNNQNLVNYIAMEASVEDCLNILKKAFERKIINFPECVRYIRIFSREMIKIKTVRDKLIKY